MKKFYSILLAAILSFSLVACTDNGDNRDDEPNPGTSVTDDVDNDTDEPDETEDNDDNDDNDDNTDGIVNEDDRVVDDIDGWTTEVEETWLTVAKGLFYADEFMLYDAISQTHRFIPDRLSIDEQLKDAIDTASYGFRFESNREDEDNYRFLFMDAGAADGVTTISVSIQDMTDSSFEPEETEATNGWEFDFYIDEESQIFLNANDISSLLLAVPFETGVCLQTVELEPTNEETKVHAGSVPEEITSQIYEVNNLMEGKYELELEEHDIFSIVDPIIEVNVSSDSDNSISIGAFGGFDSRNFLSVKEEHLIKMQTELDKLYSAIMSSLKEISISGADNDTPNEDLLEYQPEVEDIEDDVVEIAYLAELDRARFSNQSNFEMIDVPLYELIQATNLDDDIVRITFTARVSHNVSGEQMEQAIRGVAFFEPEEENGEYSFELVDIQLTT